MHKNKVKLKGTVASDLETLYIGRNKSKMYRFLLNTARLSDATDTVLVQVPADIVNTNNLNLQKGSVVAIQGCYHSFNDHSNHQSKLILYIYTINIRNEQYNTPDINEIELTGNICKPVIHRTTPSGKRIADVFLAVRRNNYESDYIPCIVWSINADIARNFKIGDCINLKGRIQSRTYIKQLNNGECEERIAYEVSANHMTDMQTNNIIDKTP